MIRFRNMEDEQRYCLLRSELYLLVAKLGRTDPKSSSRLLRNLGKLETLAFHEGVKQGAAAFYIDRVLEPDRPPLPAHVLHRMVYEESDTPLIAHERELLAEHPEALAASVLDPTPAGAFRPLTLAEAVEQGHLSADADVMAGRRTSELRPVEIQVPQAPARVLRARDRMPPELADQHVLREAVEAGGVDRGAEREIEKGFLHEIESEGFLDTPEESLLKDKARLSELLVPELVAELEGERPSLEAVEEAIAIAKNPSARSYPHRRRPPDPEKERRFKLHMIAVGEIERSARSMVQESLGPVIERVVREELSRARAAEAEDDIDHEFDAALAEEHAAEHTEEDRPTESPATIERMRDVLMKMLGSGYKPESYSELVLALHRTMMMDAAFIDLQLSSPVGRAMLEQCGLIELRVSALDPNVVKFYESAEELLP